MRDKDRRARGRRLLGGIAVLVGTATAVVGFAGPASASTPSSAGVAQVAAAPAHLQGGSATPMRAQYADWNW